MIKTNCSKFFLCRLCCLHTIFC